MITIKHKIIMTNSAIQRLLTKMCGDFFYTVKIKKYVYFAERMASLPWFTISVLLEKYFSQHTTYVRKVWLGTFPIISRSCDGWIIFVRTINPTWQMVYTNIIFPLPFQPKSFYRITDLQSYECLYNHFYFHLWLRGRLIC